jgi:Ca2+/Na+ antiporter
MPYGLIVLFGSIGLVAYFDFATEASRIAKIVVSGIFVFSLAIWFGRIAINPLVGLFLLVALSVYITFYQIWQRARTGK